jgi:ATP-dependent exoDNAse (exonuclease V) beta subunit
MGESGRCMKEWGELTSPDASEQKLDGNTSNILLGKYPTSVESIDLRIGEQRYFDEENSQQLSARNIGIMMHSVLSEAHNRADITSRIEQLTTSGRIDKEQAEELHAMIEREFSRAEVQEWFSEWDEVRTESDILCSHTIGTRRPDRVMISGERAVVVDYKFGERHTRAHERQVKEYMQLLSQMGYKLIEGYLWYLSTGEIVKIEN